jgi:hypothetical protein
MQHLPNFIQTLGLAVGMLLMAMLCLGTVLMLMINIFQRFNGWNETGYKRRLVDGLEEMIDEFSIGSDAGLMCDYIRGAIVKGEEIRAVRAREYVFEHTHNPVADLHGSERYQQRLSGARKQEAQ